MSNHPRPDLGPRLRELLAQARRAPLHQPPLAGTAPDVHAIRHAPAHNIPVYSFSSFDATQLEARLLWQTYGGGTRRPGGTGKTHWPGGTRKIADLPRVCVSLQHDPPAMMVYEPGVWEHVCPACGDRRVFTVTRPVF